MLYVSVLSILSAFFIGLTGPELKKQYTVYQLGAGFCKKLGSEPAKPQLVELAQTALKAMGVQKRHFIQFYKAQRHCGSTSWQMWLKDEGILGPVEFVIFHEAAHIALGHFYNKITDDSFTAEMAKSQEVEADLLACQTLFELGMEDVILDHIREIEQAITICKQQPDKRQIDTHDHPTYEEIYHYLSYFARSKGLMLKDQL